MTGDRNKLAAGFIETDRLTFRTWRPDNLALALALWGDPAVTKLIDARSVLSEADVKEKLDIETARQQAYGVQYWPMFLKEDGDLVGCCGLRPWEADPDALETGVHLRKKYWGQGLAVEASRAVIAYAFDVLKVKTLFAGHNPNNKASAALLPRLGFVYDHHEFYPPTGLEHPSYRFSINRYRSMKYRT